MRLVNWVITLIVCRRSWEKAISELKQANNSLQQDIEQKEKMEQMRTEFMGKCISRVENSDCSDPGICRRTERRS